MAQGKIKNADIATGAAIDRAKIATGTANGVVVNDGGGALSSVAPGTSGNVLTSNGTAWVSSASSGGLPTATNTGDLVTWSGSAWTAQRPGGIQSPPWRKAGELWLPADGTVGTNSAVSFSTGVLRADWWTAPSTGTLDAIGVYVSSAVAGAVGRLGIFSIGTDGYGSARLVDSGEISLASTGIAFASVSVPVVANTGYIRVLLNGVASASLHSRGSNSVMYSLIISPGLNLVHGMSVAQAYGPIPATFPAGAATLTAANVPLIFVRYAP